MRFLLCCISAFMLSGCANHANNAVRIKNDLMGGRTAALSEYRNNPFVQNAESPIEEGKIYRNATAAAVYHRNIEAVRYLISQDLIHKVSVRHKPVTGGYADTPVNVPAAELACGLAAFDIMELLQKSYPDEKVDYTNCLHYLVGSGYIYMSYSYNYERDRAEIVDGVKKVLALGGDPNALPDYGRPIMLDAILIQTLQHQPDPTLRLALLKLLLDNGVDPNKAHPNLNASETLLTNLAIYIDEQLASDAARMLVEYGAQINQPVAKSVIVGLESPYAYAYQTRDVTALHMARFHNRDDFSATLIELGANLEIKDNLGQTAEQYAGNYIKIESKRRQLVASAPEKAPSSEKEGGSAMGTIYGILGVGAAVMGF